jgi:hypothetical protein
VKRELSSRDMAFCGLFGAAALLLPILFHAIHLGRVFLPMYLPLMVLAFSVRPLPAAVTAFITPLVSGAVTGMPPFFPPVALFMALELAMVSGLIAAVHRRWPRLNEWVVLVPALLFGRAAYIGLVYFFSLFISLPAVFMASLSFASGWPGMVLMVAVVPPVVRAKRPSPREPKRLQKGNPNET